MSKTNDSTKTRELTEAELSAVNGGFFQSAFSNAIKAIGEGLTAIARKG